jgi:DNA primase
LNSDYSLKESIIDELYPVNLFFSKKQVKCIFHDESTPSAHVYPDGLYCFVCNRTFRSSEVAKQLGFSITEVYSQLVEQFGSEKKLLSIYENKMKGNISEMVSGDLLFIDDLDSDEEIGDVSEYTRKFFMK